MSFLAYKINAFTNSPTGGNPAGLVINPPSLTDQQMKWITQQLKVSETAFLSPSKNADFRVRFFSPDVEVDLCGHATIATFYTLAAKGYFLSSNYTVRVTQETNVGILSVEITFQNNYPERVMMLQQTPILKAISYNINDVAMILGIPIDAIDSSLPQKIVSTGLFTLPICLHSRHALEQVSPDFNQISLFCKKHGVGSWHVFTFDVKEKTSIYHARNFAPLYGINEDPVTGTANGAVTYFLYHHQLISSKTNICEQGDIIGQPGRVQVDLHNNQVKVGGTAYLVKQVAITPP